MTSDFFCLKRLKKDVHKVLRATGSDSSIETDEWNFFNCCDIFENVLILVEISSVPDVRNPIFLTKNFRNQFFEWFWWCWVLMSSQLSTFPDFSCKICTTHDFRTNFDENSTFSLRHALWWSKMCLYIRKYWLWRKKFRGLNLSKNTFWTHFQRLGNIGSDQMTIWRLHNIVPKPKKAFFYSFVEISSVPDVRIPIFLTQNF